MLEDLIVYRGIERAFALLVGGVSIWCGFRLFLSASDKPPDGQLEVSISKDKRLLLTRIGPGTFFGLFGTAVVIASYMYPVSLQTSEGTFSGAGQREVAVFSSAGIATPPPATPTEMALALSFVRELEARQPDPASPEDASWQARRFRDLKLAIMARNWRAEWGDFEGFGLWLGEATPRAENPAYSNALAFMNGQP